MNSTDSSERARTLFRTGYNCAQSTFAALAPRYGLSEADALRTTSAFGGGIARTGGICGALSGVLMALSLKRGVPETSPEIKNAIYDSARNLIDAFVETWGSANCAELTGCDPATEEGRAAAAARNVHDTLCTRFIASAIELLDRF